METKNLIHYFPTFPEISLQARLLGCEIISHTGNENCLVTEQISF